MNLHLNAYGQGIPVVFFHGWGFTHTIWLSLVSQLSADYHLILVDLPGFGATEQIGWPEFKQQLLSQLPEQFAVIGWSLGGLYATRLALESSRVTQLINIASSPRFLMDEEWPGVSKAVFASFYHNLLKNPEATLEEFVQLHAGKRQFQLHLDKSPSPDSLALGLEILETWDFRNSLKTYKRPVTYMFGRLDPIVPVKTMKAMQMIYPTFNYVFFNRAAHMPFLSHQDMFVNELRGLL
ncbi:MAG: alpha/beta fold hydrolase [Legionella sp.]|uniref:alpha/beta fold hydrolase n=1 Tax=Legionella sp. TaxID=459 RepID=UPI0039E39B6F